MREMIKNVQLLGNGESLDRAATTGVSLHCHTLHSQELLDFVPYYASRIPIASYFWQAQMKKHERIYGSTPNFSTGHWTPPLSGNEVFDSEAQSIGRLGLDSIVSITDHDNISASWEVQGRNGPDRAPISFEWTVPFEEGFFHIGVHNLPVERAKAITSDLLDYMRSKHPETTREKLHRLFEMLNEIPSVLVVLNHPIWDIEMIGQSAHQRLLDRFLSEFSVWIHAIEINGFRSLAENQTAAELAESLELPTISGGDRHCLQRNTILNITNARSFAEFVYEIRCEARSKVVVLPEYRRPLPCRQIKSIRQILAQYDSFPEGRRNWADRVYLDFKDGNGLRTLSESWDGKIPGWTIPAFMALRILTLPSTLALLGLVLGDVDIGRDDGHQKETTWNAAPKLVRPVR